MEDSNRNAGNQRYHDLYSQPSGRSADGGPVDYSSGRDYSDARDYSTGSLNDLEQRAGEQQANTHANASQGLDVAENQASGYTTSGFDTESRAKAKANPQTKSRRSKFRGRAVGAGVLSLSVTGGLVALFMSITQFAQFIQIASVGKDFLLNIIDGQTSARTVNINRSLSRLVDKNNTTTAVQRSRLGILGQKQAKSMTERLAAKGVQFKTDSSGFYKGMEIDIAKFSNGADDLADAGERLAKDMDIPGKYRVEGGKLLIDEDISYSQAKRVIKTLDDPGHWRLSSWTQGRSTLNGLGFNSWLHPFEKAKNKAWKTVTDFIDGKIANLADDDDVKSRITGDTDSDEDHPDADANKSGAAQQYDKVKAEVEATPKKKGMRGVWSKAKSTVIDPIVDLQQYKSFQAVSLVVGLICAMRSISQEAGPYKMQYIANPSEKGAAQIYGIGAQIQSGEDLDANTVGLASKAMLYDEVPVLDGQGNPTGEKVGSSATAAPEYCDTLGITNCDSYRNTPTALGDVANKAAFFHNSVIDNLIYNFFSAAGGLIDMICIAFAIANFADIFGTVIGGLTSAVLGQLKFFNDFMSNAMNYFLGRPLDIANATPRQWGSIFMYGSKFMANHRGVMAGGMKLASAQAAALNIENRQYLAWENSRKPLMARLVDPTDYNSTLNQVARSLQLNTSDGKFTTQLANAMQTLVSAPTILANANNQLLGNSGYVSAKTSDVNYGVSTYAWSLEDANANTQSHDVFDNAEQAIKILEAERQPGVISTPHYDYAKDCLLSDISKDDQYKVTAVNNDDGSAWNYVDQEGSDDHHCKQLAGQEDYKVIGRYVMDYQIIASGACYNGDENDSESSAACEEVGVGSAGGGSSAGGAVDTSGNGDANAIQQQFYNETKCNYKLPGGGVYTVSGNGCTTIPAWYISAHTNLAYGGGNGGQVVNGLLQMNTGKLQATNKPTKVPAIFSSYDSSMGAVTVSKYCHGKCGHTGLVVSINEDGSFVTLETATEDTGKKFCSRIETHPASDIGSRTQFVYVGDHLK